MVKNRHESGSLPSLWVPDVRGFFPIEALPALGSGKLDLKRVSGVAREKAENPPDSST